MLINNTYDGSGERLFRIRKALDMTQIEFAKIVNSSNGHVSDMEKDRKNITESTIELLKLKCNVNEDWLRTGSGDMFSKTPSSTMEQLKKEFDLDEFSFNLVHEYLKLLPAQRKTIRDFVYRVIKPIENIDYTAETSKITEEMEERKQSSNHPTTGSEQDATMEEIEAEYKKSRLNSVRKTKSSALNSTADTEFGSENGDFASNQ